MDKFTLAYIEAALWSSTDDNGEPLDNGGHELAEETRAMGVQCQRIRRPRLLAHTLRSWRWILGR